jgi:hypothetical protein
MAMSKANDPPVVHQRNVAWLEWRFARHSNQATLQSSPDELLVLSNSVAHLGESLSRAKRRLNLIIKTSV